MAEVVLLRWPEERRQARELAETGMAVLFLLREDADPPTLGSCLEDWVRMPGDERDLRARVAALKVRAGAHHRPPSVDGLGRLHHDGHLLALSPTEARLAAMLVDRFDEVVADRDLADCAIAGEPSASTSLRAHMARLRHRLRDTNLVVRRVRGQGYQLEHR